MFFLKRSLLESGINQQRTLKPLAYDVVILQGCIVALLFVASVFFSRNVMLSVLSGCLCAWIPHAYFVWKACGSVGARVARQTVMYFYIGELGKFILTVLLLIFVFTQIKSLLPLVFFGAYIIVQGVQWFIPLLVRNCYLGCLGGFYGR